jgi:hypothetical protein
MQMFDMSTTTAKYRALLLVIVNVSCPKVCVVLQGQPNSIVNVLRQRTFTYILKADSNITCVSNGGWALKIGDLIWKEQSALIVTVIGAYLPLCSNISYHRTMTVAVDDVVK